MENYFILLELPFDPPENDDGTILAAISKKKRDWCSEASAVKVARHREYLSHLDEIKKVMLDPVLRKQEAENAKLIRAEQHKCLRNKLRLYHAKMTVLSERDMKFLMQQFGKYGFTAEEIKSEFKRTFLGSD